MWPLCPVPGTELLNPIEFPEDRSYLLLLLMSPFGHTCVYANEAAQSELPGDQEDQTSSPTSWERVLDIGLYNS